MVITETKVEQASYARNKCTCGQLTPSLSTIRWKNISYTKEGEGDKHFYIHGGQTFSASGGSGNDDFDSDEDDLMK